MDHLVWGVHCCGACMNNLCLTLVFLFVLLLRRFTVLSMKCFYIPYIPCVQNMNTRFDLHTDVYLLSCSVTESEALAGFHLLQAVALFSESHDVLVHWATGVTCDTMCSALCIDQVRLHHQINIEIIIEYFKNRVRKPMLPNSLTKGEKWELQKSNAQEHSEIYTLKHLCYLSQVESGWRGFSTLCWWQTHQQRVCILLRSPSTLIPNATPPSRISSNNWLQSHWNPNEFHWILILSKFKKYINTVTQLMLQNGIDFIVRNYAWIQNNTIWCGVFLA